MIQYAAMGDVAGMPRTGVALGRNSEGEWRRFVLRTVPGLPPALRIDAVTGVLVPSSRNQRNVRSSVMGRPEGRQPLWRGYRGMALCVADHECVPNVGQTLLRGFPQSATS